MEQRFFVVDPGVSFGVDCDAEGFFERFGRFASFFPALDLRFEFAARAELVVDGPFEFHFVFFADRFFVGLDGFDVDVPFRGAARGVVDRDRFGAVELAFAVTLEAGAARRFSGAGLDDLFARPRPATRTGCAPAPGGRLHRGRWLLLSSSSPLPNPLREVYLARWCCQAPAHRLQQLAPRLTLSGSAHRRRYTRDGTALNATRGARGPHARTATRFGCAETSGGSSGLRP